MESFDLIIIGAGAAGLMSAIAAGKRGKRVCVLDHANKPGKKILISGGGRCNFTNYHLDAGNYLSQNPHFCKSALARYTQWDFIAMVERYRIPYHERDHGQLFCDNKAADIVDMLLTECGQVGVSIRCNTTIVSVDKAPGGFALVTEHGRYQATSLIVATGGLSIPKMGATALGLQLAEQFGHHIVRPRAGLVPFTLHERDKLHYQKLSGIGIESKVCAQDGTCFREALLFTHRGLSGPAALQISSCWNPGEYIEIDLLPGVDVAAFLSQAAADHPRQSLRNTLAQLLPKRLVEARMDDAGIADAPLNQLTPALHAQVTDCLHHWRLKPNATEGYRTAEVTVGGVDTHELSSKTMQSNKVPGLYFVGEVVDVTGHLGGYNFQWAWSSGYAAGQAVE